MKKSVLIVSIIIGVVVAGGIAVAALSGPTDSNTDQIASESGTVLTVEGMTCGRCVDAITRAVSALGGVNKVSVVLRTGKVTIDHDPNVTADEIREAIMNAGYTPLD
ncbi:cation transporter [Candidatus Saccharibacteria bacterium]|nr:cation transporter [Candidatus Saccharibacteria bacterium]